MKTTEQRKKELIDDKYPGPTDWRVSTEEKRWTDEDIRNAWEAGYTAGKADYYQGSNRDGIPYSVWLKQYKAKKQ